MRDVTTYVYDMSIDHRRIHEDLLYTHFRVRTDAISQMPALKIKRFRHAVDIGTPTQYQCFIRQKKLANEYRCLHEKHHLPRDFSVSYKMRTMCT